MKVVVLGSSKFRKDKVRIVNQLKDLGLEPIIDDISIKMASGKMDELVKQEESESAEVKKKYDFIRWYHNAIKNSDAVLVCNYTKNNIENYIGANSFLEMGDAHMYGKKIFILNEIPDQEYIRDEVDAMETIVINGDLTKIK